MAKKTPGLTTAPVVPNRVTKFVSAVIPRSEINEAPYNPRFIDDRSAEKLELVLLDETIGLVEPLVFNKRTGNLVGGHQRLGRMDAIHEGANYEVPVSIIDVDEATERRINVLLNNPAMQGSWDVPKLEQLFRDENVSPFEAGFEVADLTNLFPTDVVVEFINQYIPDDPPEVVELPGETAKETLEQTADEIAEIKEARAKHKAADGEALRADHHITIVFDTPAECQRAQAALRLPVDEQFFLADRFFEAIRKHGAAFLGALAALGDAAPPVAMNDATAGTLALIADADEADHGAA